MMMVVLLMMMMMMMIVMRMMTRHVHRPDASDDNGNVGDDEESDAV